MHEPAFGIVICFGSGGSAALAAAEPPGGARSPSLSAPVAAALEPPGGARSPSSRSFIAAALASAVPPGGARSPSSRNRPRPGPPLWPWLPFLALTPTMTLRLVGGSSHLFAYSASYFLRILSSISASRFSLISAIFSWSASSNRCLAALLRLDARLWLL